MSEQEVVGGLRLCGYRYGIFRELPGRPARVVWAGWSLRRAWQCLPGVCHRRWRQGARFVIRKLSGFTDPPGAGSAGWPRTLPT
jgi:hypothetical protein